MEDLNNSSAGQPNGMFEQAAVGITHAEPDTRRILKSNSRFQDMVGYSESEILEMTIDDLILAADLKVENQRIQDLLDDRMSAYTNEFRVACKDGTRIWTRNTVLLVRDSDGRPEYLVGILEDITERKSSEDRLKKSELKFRNLIELAADAIIIVNDQLEIVQMNAESERMFGYRREEAQGRKIELFIPTDKTQVHVAHRDNYLGKPIARAMGIGQELSALNKDGTIFPVEISLNPMETEDGLIISATVRDITERKDAERTLAVSEERLRLATKGGRIGVWDWDVRDGQLIWDDSMCALYGIDPQTFDGTIDAWSNSLRPEDRQTSDENLRLALAGEQPFDTEFRVVHPNGDVRWIRGIADVIRDDSNTAVRMVGVNWDITEQRTAETEVARYRDHLEELVDARTEELQNEIREREKVERRMRESVDELERFRKMAVGRENKMVALKKEINDLLGQIGRDPKYSVVE